MDSSLVFYRVLFSFRLNPLQSPLHAPALPLLSLASFLRLSHNTPGVIFFLLFPLPFWSL